MFNKYIVANKSFEISTFGINNLQEAQALDIAVFGNSPNAKQLLWSEKYWRKLLTSAEHSLVVRELYPNGTSRMIADLVVKRSPQQANEFTIYTVAVLPEAQREGHATQLLNELLHQMHIKYNTQPLALQNISFKFSMRENNPMYSLVTKLCKSQNAVAAGQLAKFRISWDQALEIVTAQYRRLEDHIPVAVPATTTFGTGLVGLELHKQKADRPEQEDMDKKQRLPVAAELVPGVVVTEPRPSFDLSTPLLEQDASARRNSSRFGGQCNVM